MPRPDPRRPREGQAELFGADAIPRAEPDMLVRGRHSEAMDRALNAAADKGLTEDVDEGLLTLARAGAWSLDAFEAQNKPYGPAKLLDPLREVLAAARLTPDARQTTVDDQIAELLADLGDPDPADQPTTT